MQLGNKSILLKTSEHWAINHCLSRLNTNGVYRRCKVNKYAGIGYFNGGLTKICNRGFFFNKGQ